VDLPNYQDQLINSHDFSRKQFSIYNLLGGLMSENRLYPSPVFRDVLAALSL